MRMRVRVTSRNLTRILARVSCILRADLGLPQRPLGNEHLLSDTSRHPGMRTAHPRMPSKQLQRLRIAIVHSRFTTSSAGRAVNGI